MTKVLRLRELNTGKGAKALQTVVVFSMEAGKIKVVSGDGKAAETLVRCSAVVDRKGKKVTPDKGDEYIRGLLDLYDHGTYMRLDVVDDNAED